MANYRLGRINEEMAKELSDILRTVKDPRISSAFITITAVDCTPDLKYAKIYYSTIGNTTDEDVAALSKGFKSAMGYIRSQLAVRLNLRITPELKFIRDMSLEHGAVITKLLNQIESELSDEEASSESEDNEN